MSRELTLFKRFCNTVWEYDAVTNRVYLHSSQRTPHLCGTWRSYEEVYTLHRNQYIYKEDADIWAHYMLPENLRRFLSGEKEEEHFLVRTKYENYEIEWREAYLEKISDTKLFVGSRDINETQRNATVSQAAMTEMDYVCRIDIETRNYVFYYSGDVRGLAPQHESNDFHKAIIEFNKRVVMPEECEALSRQMMIPHVIAELAEKEEYILYATIRDEGQEKLSYKKFRFCYADAQKRELLLVRMDVTSLMEEKKGRELEEKRRMQYLENMPIGFCSTKVLLDENGQPKDFCFMYCNRAHEEIEGVAPGELIGKNFYEFFDNADPKWLRYYYETAYFGKPHVIQEYSPEIGKDLLIRTFQVEEGHCECIVRDVTQETFLSDELQRSREEMKRVLETTTDLVFQYYPQQRSVSFRDLGTAHNERALAEEIVIQKMIGKGYLEEASEIVVKQALKDIRDGKQNISSTIRARKTIDQPWSWFKIVLFDYQDEHTRERRVLGYLQNIDHDIVVQEQLKQMAQIDYLTGILNVGAGKQKIKELLGKQNEADEEYNAMFIMDIDDFKSVNDTLGHMVGDEVLKCFAQVLIETFRTEDIVYRLGGDEFAAFVERISDYEAALESIMERFHQQFAQARKTYPFLGTSVGIFVSNTIRDYQRYYQEADRALYQTKKNGKNHYTIRIATKKDVYSYHSQHRFDAGEKGAEH